jgi:hypothetical protein
MSVGTLLVGVRVGVAVGLGTLVAVGGTLVAVGGTLVGPPVPAASKWLQAYWAL